MDLSEKLVNKCGCYLAKNRRAKITRFIHGNLINFYYRIENVDFNPITNGEKRILQCLGQFQPQVVFDVGANVGDWSKMACRLTQAKIHSFEILPETFNRLKKNLENLNNIQLNNFGLSSKNGEEKIFFKQAGDCTATTLPLDEQDYPRSKKVKVITGDSYIKNKKISKVDLLKIDVEGMEHDVLQGFVNSFNIINMIQFEYGVFNIASHFLLYDYYRLLEKDYLIGKVYPDHVEFFKYRFIKENFMGNNYIAIKKNAKDLIKKLSNK